MKFRGRKFELDKGEGKFLGVCSGLANYSAVDVTIIRIALVVATIVFFPWPAAAYFLMALLGRQRPAHPYDAMGSGGDRTTERVRDMDRRLAEIESYVTSSNRQLANEIDRLR